jgi:hypothetical protein
MSSSTIVGDLSPGEFPSDKLARVAGLLYFSSLPTVGFGVFSAQSLLENAASSAATQIAASRSVLEVGVLVGALGAVTWLVLAVLFHALFRPVSDRACKLLVAFMVACALLMLAAFARRMDAISLVTHSQELGVDDDQLRVLTALAVRSSDNLMQVSFIFSAVWLLPFGYLVFRSGFLPKTLGVLLMLGAPFYLMSFVDAALQLDYVKTLLAQVIGIVSGVPGIAGELGTGLWLLFRGTRGTWRSAAALQPSATGTGT